MSNADFITVAPYQDNTWEQDRYSPLPIDPFGANPHLASRIVGLGGDRVAPNPAYVLETNPLRTAVGPIVFVVEFIDLQATSGTLVLHVLARPEHLKTSSTPVATIAVTLSDLIEHHGVACIAAVGRRNMLYSISAELSDDSDATASAIRVSLDRREESDPAWQPRNAAARRAALPANGPKLRDQPELISLQPPVLTKPVSQPMTPLQFAEPAFAKCMAELDQPPGREGATAWEDALLLQALRYYGVMAAGARGLCFDRTARPLAAYVAGQDCSLTVVSDWPGTPPDDSGALLASLARPALCRPDVFAGAVHLVASATLDRIDEVAEYDFLWSAGVSATVEGKAAFPHFLLDSMRHLRFGGTAIHLIRYGAPNPAAPAPFTRPEIERMALSLVAQGQEVAQVKFAVAEIGTPEIGASIPFAILARRTS